jgi:poly(3-hydroxybutyrate) depolymerase
VTATPVGSALKPTGTNSVTDTQGRAWTYDYYISPNLSASPPLVVALHGCSETPPDFEEGTRWYEDAKANGYVVIMPRHITGGYGGSSDGNLENCWQFWNQHTRGSGETAIVRSEIAQIESEVPRIDTHRVYAVGMSGGAFYSVAMAVAYPEVFAGIGVGSGGEYDPCKPWSEQILDDNNLNDPGMSCYQELNAGGKALPDPTAQGDEAYADLVANGGPKQGAPIPAVFVHGDADSLVGFPNEAMGYVCMARFNDRFSNGGSATGAFNTTVQYTHSWQAVIPGGWAYDEYHADNGLLQWWVVHGMNHAWSGGTQDDSSNATGGLDSHNYNDPRGPGATQLMRYFLFGLRKS